MISCNLNKIFLILVLLLFGFSAAVFAGTTPIENQVKTAMVYNMAKFIDWPEGTFSNEQSPIVFCWLGTDSFKDELKLLSGKSLKNRKISVKRATSLEEIGVCHVLIVGNDYRGQVEEIRTRVKEKGIFTVSDMIGFADKGGMAELFTVAGRVRFNVNLLSVKESSLVISSQVLKLAFDVIE